MEVPIENAFWCYVFEILYSAVQVAKRQYSYMYIMLFSDLLLRCKLHVFRVVERLRCNSIKPFSAAVSHVRNFAPFSILCSNAFEDVGGSTAQRLGRLSKALLSVLKRYSVCSIPLFYSNYCPRPSPFPTLPRQQSFLYDRFAALPRFFHFFSSFYYLLFTSINNVEHSQSFFSFQYDHKTLTMNGELKSRITAANILNDKKKYEWLHKMRNKMIIIESKLAE